MATKKKKNIKKKKTIASFLLIIILIIVLMLILFSKWFNIKKITVKNNLKVSTEEIINNSELTTDSNIFKSLKSKIKSGIKRNPYIEDVKITKKINGEVILEVEERTPTFILQIENGYAYINNQGYILEISEQPLNLQSIRGFETTEIIPGQRLCVKDLQKLDIINQIMEAAKSNKLIDIITSIDIADETNFILEIPSENKTVSFGDKTNINEKILWIAEVLKLQKDIPGEIFLNVKDLKKVYFREKV